ncbi:putative cytochrome P450 [Rosellinia necatrix]|uniref:Putative cytochrome P450 n=1 Tax=Rosellinia necatrix TaxID=77044 RepID=A0A1W2TT99_ROSNE|nr:putative cytochrome P450 [Rosellinia necatrix]
MNFKKIPTDMPQTWALGAILVVSLLTLIVYRLWLHPLAKVPGPRLAALTYWYETYFELAHRSGGQFTFHIKELHSRYGPIVRINPDEVHIDDPNFYSKLYNNRDGHDKPGYLKWRFGSPHTLFSTPEHSIHRMRRAAQDPFFSRGKVLEFAPQMRAIVDRMCDRLSDDFLDRDRYINLGDMFTSYVADITTLYAFDRDFRYLEDPDFVPPFVKAIRGFKSIAQPFAQFPWLAKLMSMMPDSVVCFLQPSMSVILAFKDHIDSLIRDARHEFLMAAEKPRSSRRTIIHGVLGSNLPQEELSSTILRDQAVGLIGAGIASSQWTLVIAFFHIIENKDIYKMLKEELVSAIPDPNQAVDLDKKLEKCRFLTACVEEAIRLACGQIARSPRISSRAIQYEEHILPPGTIISMDTWHMHHHPGIYPDSFTFKPERWLDGARAPYPYESKPLKHYLTSFGKGTRNCIGINLAYAEITLAIAYLMRRFEWELVETTYTDVEIVRDLIAPDVSRASKGVRALVKSAHS